MGITTLLACILFFILLFISVPLLQEGIGASGAVGEIFPNINAPFAIMLVVSVWFFLVGTYSLLKKGSDSQE